MWSRHYYPANIPQLVITLNYNAISSQPPLQNSSELIVPSALVINSRHGPHRKHRHSIVAFVSVTAGTCLPSCCPETGCVIPFIKNLLSYRRALICDRYPASGTRYNNVYYSRHKCVYKRLFNSTDSSHRKICIFKSEQ
jgi:hypothetical protein